MSTKTQQPPTSSPSPLPQYAAEKLEEAKKRAEASVARMKARVKETVAPVEINPSNPEPT